jgi:predicted HicB family RNase H-like nuclease
MYPTLGAHAMPIETRSADLKIRIRPSLKAAIERAADHDGRSISSWIERLIEQALERHPTAQDDKPKRK